MLMDIETSIVQSLKVSLTFDNNKTKEREISVGDLCYFEFNKNGVRKTIEGKVVKIGFSNTSNSNSWFIVVDGSLDFNGTMERFCPNNILDVDIIQKHDTHSYVETPNDFTRVTNIRYVNGLFQVSIDGGYSWATPKNFGGSGVDDGDYGHPHCDKKPHKKPIYIEGDTSEDYPSDDEDVIEDESY